ncbi:hypothetical protein CLV62_101271 [Dysgonomonas alginatilytica]|uniref:Uncharacterized protein n=1 Tax=Dysgonomonas alginatilytica TaxID=1605892 RepID=A0A2V3PW30_9BACT|nr:hypothetical protein [Dysgonomonas alginatilytica]PXV69004.1 hypothetical protein CLV62_101271 [Dysgonomonas alginatilytica]
MKKSKKISLDSLDQKANFEVLDEFMQSKLLGGGYAEGHSQTHAQVSHTQTT